MVKPGNKSVGILGGSFDPPHKGHLTISKIAIKKVKLDRVLWVVTKKNPFKKKPFYSLSQRIKMTKKITRNTRKIQIIHLDKIIFIKNKPIIISSTNLRKKNRISN